MNNNNTIDLFVEQPIIQVPEGVKDVGNGKVRFNAILQVADEVNANKRRYPLPLLKAGLEAKRPDMERGMFYGELDHPLEHLDKPPRIANVYFKNACHTINDYHFDGPTVRGVLTTLAATEAGRTLSKLITLDNAPIGFSVRALGQGQPQPDGSILVGPPFTIIAYDAVTKPSHKAAMIQMPIQQALRESFENNPNNQPKLLTESISPLSGKKQHVVCFNGKCFLLEHIDKILGNKIRDLIESYL